MRESESPIEVTDYQIIDVYNDHLCYVITERKTAWFLPHSSDFTLVLKIVITHVAKSRCKLSLYTRIEWAKPPLAGKGMLLVLAIVLELTISAALIESQASAYIQSYASSLADIISDQTSRLGSDARTSARRAMHVFGAVGQQTQSVQLLASDLAAADLKGSKRLHYRSLPRLALYAVRRMAIAYTFVGLGWVLQLFTWTLKTVSAHKLLIVVLALSAVTNLFYSSRDTWDWWQERKAAHYMARLGVRPNAVMGRSIWLRDLDDLVLEARGNQTDVGHGVGAW